MHTASIKTIDEVMRKMRLIFKKKFDDSKTDLANANEMKYLTFYWYSLSYI